jgi:hypothetical protein
VRHSRRGVADPSERREHDDDQSGESKSQADATGATVPSRSAADAGRKRLDELGARVRPLLAELVLEARSLSIPDSSHTRPSLAGQALAQRYTAR